MRAFPSEVGVRVGDRLACTASANRAALVMLAVRTDRDDGIGAESSIAPVECDVEIFAGIAHLTAVQRLLARPGMGHEPPPPRCVRATAVLTDRRDAHLGGFDATDDGTAERGIDGGRRIEKCRIPPGASHF